MKKIAVSCSDKKSLEGFEHCSEFEIYETEAGQVEKQWTIHNINYTPTFLPLYLSDIGVKVIISEDMDQNELAVCNKRGMETIVGAHGNVEDNVEAYLEGKLVSSPVAC